MKCAKTFAPGCLQKADAYSAIYSLPPLRGFRPSPFGSKVNIYTNGQE